MSWRCSRCHQPLGSHTYLAGAIECPPDDEPTDKDDE